MKLPKKGDLAECGNWRVITLLPFASKVLGRVVINRIKAGIDEIIRSKQAGFSEGKSTTEQIFILRNIIGQFMGDNEAIWHTEQTHKYTVYR